MTGDFLCTLCSFVPKNLIYAYRICSNRLSTVQRNFLSFYCMELLTPQWLIFKNNNKVSKPTVILFAKYPSCRLLEEIKQGWMPLNIVRPFISPGVSQHFHNKKHFMRSESFECLTQYNLSWGMLAKRQLAPCLLKRALEALPWHQIVLAPACLVEKTSAFIECSLLLLHIRSVFLVFIMGCH